MAGEENCVARTPFLCPPLHTQRGGFFPIYYGPPRWGGGKFRVGFKKSPLCGGDHRNFFGVQKKEDDHPLESGLPPNKP